MPKLNMDGAPSRVRNSGEVNIGDVYQSQKGTLWVIVSIRERFSCQGDQAVALVIERDGSISNAVCYGASYFASRKLVGVVTNLPEVLEVEWQP